MLTNGKKVDNINNKIVGFGDHTPEFILNGYFRGRKANVRKVSTVKNKQQVA